MGCDYEKYSILASDGRVVWYKLSYVLEKPAVSNCGIKYWSRPQMVDKMSQTHLVHLLFIYKV